MEKATSIAEVYEIQPCVPRTTGKQENRNNVEADTLSAYWKRSLYLPFLDHLVNELDEQLVKPLPGFQAQLLIPGKELYLSIYYPIQTNEKKEKKVDNLNAKLVGRRQKRNHGTDR